MLVLVGLYELWWMLLPIYTVVGSCIYVYEVLKREEGWARSTYTSWRVRAQLCVTIIRHVCCYMAYNRHTWTVLISSLTSQCYT